MEENKKVTWRHLVKGQEIKGYELSNRYCGITGFVKDANAAYVTVEMWRQGGEEQRIDSEAWFFVPMTEEEIIQQYNTDAGKIVQSLQNQMYPDEIGYKEMWNAWLSTNPWEMAQYCRKHKVTILGYCKDIIPKKAMFSGDILDVGICAVDEDGDRFWCHFRGKDIEVMKRTYEKYQDHIKNRISGDVDIMTLQYEALKEMCEDTNV